MVKSVYIHIPFCDNICSYCDFCKMYYKEEWVSNYLVSLEKEIKQNYRNEIIKTIYIGGGTPSCLNENQLLKLFEIIKIFKTSNDLEYTIECNLDSLNYAKIELFKKYKINRVSIGIQTFNKKHLEFLNRKEGNISTIIKQLKDAKIDNINVDLMYGFPNQTIEELKEDIKKIKELD
ncbi:MAG: radical SAM protein, partial [Bacilli bacterium]|nr:radical SAM protein [Bacilli bacterium]